MTSGWALFFGVLTALASIVAILEWLGIKPKALSWRLVVPFSTKLKLVIMVGLMVLSLGFSGYGFYRSFRPKIVERIVERQVPTICPSVPATVPENKEPARSKKQAPPKNGLSPSGNDNVTGNTVTQGAGSIAQFGGFGNTATIINKDAPRRLSGLQKRELITCLSKKPGRFSIGALQGNSEAYMYAQDWREVFISAGWEIVHKDIPIQIFMIGGGMWSGIHFSVHDASPIDGQVALEIASPEQNLYECIVSRNDFLNGGGGNIIPYKNTPTGTVSIDVSDRRQQ